MIALIPSIGLSPYLPDLLASIRDECEEIFLVDNSKEAAFGASQALDYAVEAGVDVTFIANHPASLYDGWNLGLAQSTERNTPVAILNDDIIIKPGSLTVAAEALRGRYRLIGLNFEEPDRIVQSGAPVREVWGTYRTHGFGGFAFVCAPGTPLIDSRFVWYYGDDDLAEKIKESGGKLGVATGAPVDHPNASTSGHRFSWTGEAIEGDYNLYRSLHPNGL